MKKLIAVVLTIVMVFSLTANVYAASITDNTEGTFQHRRTYPEAYCKGSARNYEFPA